MTPPIVQRLRDAAAAFREEGVSMRAMAQAHGPEAHGTLLLLLGMPCLLPVPGVGTVLGVGMAALAVAMWRGQGEPCLPQRVANLELPRHWARRVLEGLASAYETAGHHAKARLSHLAGPTWRSAVAVAVGLMAIIVVLPVPFGNLLPALALMLIGLGLVFRDGIAVILGLLMSGVAVIATTGLLLMAWVWGNEWIAPWLGRRALVVPAQLQHAVLSRRIGGRNPGTGAATTHGHVASSGGEAAQCQRRL